MTVTRMANLWRMLMSRAICSGQMDLLRRTCTVVAHFICSQLRFAEEETPDDWQTSRVMANGPRANMPWTHIYHSICLSMWTLEIFSRRLLAGTATGVRRTCVALDVVGQSPDLSWSQRAGRRVSGEPDRYTSATLRRRERLETLIDLLRLNSQAGGVS